MTAIIRVKRHMQDDPVEAVRLVCKRRRTEEAESEAPLSFEKVLSFSGTVDKKDDLVARKTVEESITNSRKNPKLRTVDVLEKIRKDNKRKTEENRFKVISCLRSKATAEEPDSKTKDTIGEITIVDLSLEKTDVSDDLCDNDDSYVYDLYSANFGNEDYNDIYLDNVIGIQPYTYETIFDMHYRSSEDMTNEEIDPDEDDSNDENNWRNSYPDEDPSDSDDLDDLNYQFHNTRMGDSSDLSSDDGEEDYPNYTSKSDKRGYYFHEAKDLGGSSYGKYKLKILKDLNNISEPEDEDEETY